MRKSLLLSAAALMTVAASAATKDSFTQFPGVRMSGLSPDGTYVVGYNNGWDDGDSFKSFIYNTLTGTTDWKTEYNTVDLDKSGQFMAVNNAGVIAGAIRDKDMQIESSGSIFAPGMKKVDGDVTYTPITSAALWKADGTLVKLGVGPYQVTDFTDGSDGSYAVGVSADAQRAVGYIQIAWVPSYPCQWTLNSTTGEYEYSLLSLPDGCNGGYAGGVSPDGAVAFGTVVNDGEKFPCIWNAQGKGQIIQLADYTLDDAGADAISANGRYLLVHGTSYSRPCVAAVYDISTGAMTQIELPADVTSPLGYAISDNGDVLLSLQSTNTWVTTLYYYSMNGGTPVEFAHWLKALKPELEGIDALNNGTPVGCSSDFSVIAGNSGNYGANPWVLTLTPGEAIVLGTPQTKDLFFSAPDKLTFKWYALSNVPEGATIKEYQATIGDKTVTVTPDKAVDGVFTATIDAEAGSYTARVKAIATTANGEIESLSSEDRSVALSENTDPLLFDNWDDATMDAQGNVYASNDWWNASLPVGSKGEVIQWSIESYNFENNTPYYTTTSIATQPWSSVLTSRFIGDAKADKLYLSYLLSYQLVNSADQLLDTDYLDVEYSTDGEHWKTLSSHRASDIKSGDWKFYITDVTNELKGKVYQIRFNAHGEGDATLKWNLDIVNLTDKMAADAPTGLQATEKNGKVELQWHNTIGAYEVSYLENSNILTDYCTGSEGTPLITAVDLTPAMTDKYAGKYITSLSCFIFDNPAIITTQPTKAEAIVYADGQEVSRAAYDKAFDSPYASTIALTTPVKIEEGKTYRIAVRVYDYDPAQTPVYYQTTDNFIAGVTDLYSEDEGKTWNKLSDVYSENNGKCIWPLRANITDTDAAAATALDNEILAYNVLINGTVANANAIYAAYPKFTVSSPAAGAKYAVQAFYRDGRISPISAEVAAVGLNNVVTDRPFIDVTGDYIIASGNVSGIEVFNLQGVKVAASSAASLSTADLARGIYVVRVQADGKYYTCKIAVSK